MRRGRKEINSQLPVPFGPLTQQIRTVKAHYKEAIQEELHKIHLDVSQSVTGTGSTSRRLNDKRRD